MAPVTVPANLAKTVVQWEGDLGREWLDRIPRLVAELRDAWGLDVGAPFEPGGNISWVAPVRRRADGVEAVLKVALPHPESAPEPAALRAWAGAGAVRLLDHDADRRALLIERCRPGRAIGDHDDPLASATLGSAIGARLHLPAASLAGQPFPTLAAVLDQWADELERRFEVGAPLDPGLAELVLSTMRDRPRSIPSQVLLHGDLNPTNILSAEREPWLAIDPKPMVGDPAYDGARLVTQPDPLATADPAGILDRRLDIVADALAVERDALVAWCLVGAVEMGAWAAGHGDEAMAATCRAHVDLVRPHLT